VIGEVLPRLWRFEALHPEWTEDEGGADGWEQSVAWWAVATPGGVVLIDPLVDDWDALDVLVANRGGCAGVLRTVYWHERDVAEAAKRYEAQIYAKPHPDKQLPIDCPVADREQIVDGLHVFETPRADEIAVWLPRQSALLFGDVMLRRDGGELRVCPESWLSSSGDYDRLREILAELAELPCRHVLVSHGPLMLGDGRTALRSALA
jgi:glyoxylase-like metal-dependent hydrolase (beta-lactamase superfamily II)